MTKIKTFKLLCGITGALLLFVAAMTAHGHFVRYHFERGTVTTRAVVIDIKIRHRKGSAQRIRSGGTLLRGKTYTAPMIRYEYEAEDRHYCGKDLSINEIPELKVGDTIHVEYAVDKPSLSRIFKSMN